MSLLVKLRPINNNLTFFFYDCTIVTCRTNNYVCNFFFRYLLPHYSHLVGEILYTALEYQKIF
jgi:hypothetical protein